VQLNKTKKRILIIVEMVLAFTALFFAVLDLVFTRYVETETVRYTYSSKGSIDYKVYLRPNVMFSEKYLGKDRYYVLKYIDYIDMEFTYDYTASVPARLDSEYSVIAYLQGLHGRDEEILWSKEIPLIPGKIQTDEDSKLNISQRVSLDLDDYSRIAQNIYLDSEVNSPVVLNIVFSIHTTASTKYGTIEDDISPSVSIPIGSSVFKIEGEPVVTGGNELTEMVKSKVPVNPTKVIVLLSTSLVFVLLAVFTAYYVKEAPPPDRFQKQIEDIFKEYSERLAGLEHTLSYQISESITISSIEDMVKIADEIGQPIFYYKVDNATERKIEFFVFDNMRTYYMVIFGDVKV
jgi:hypothetical protein